MKQQIIVIHGGDSYPTYEDYIEALKKHTITLEKMKHVGWKKRLQDDLGGDYEVLMPKMPCEYNSKYSEWKIWFDKIVPLLDEEIILIGHSQGGIFLAKYLSEENFPKRVKATFLVAAPFDEKDTTEKLCDFNFTNDLNKFEEQGGRVFLIHSEDDPTVPFVDMEKYSKLLSKAEKIIFHDRGHFHLEHFPEIVEKIKNL